MKALRIHGLEIPLLVLAAGGGGGAVGGGDAVGGGAGGVLVGDAEDQLRRLQDLGGDPQHRGERGDFAPLGDVLRRRRRRQRGRNRLLDVERIP